MNFRYPNQPGNRSSPLTSLSSSGSAASHRSAPMAANESVVVRLTGKQSRQLGRRSLRTRHGEGLCISYSEALTVNLCNEPPSLNASYLRYLGIIRAGMAQHSLTYYISSYRWFASLSRCNDLLDVMLLLVFREEYPHSTTPEVPRTFQLENSMSSSSSWRPSA